jgi:RNA polymerase sigma factor (sigma-70 family)
MQPLQTATTEGSMGESWFKTTHWTVVLEARDADSTVANAALARLCQVYWQPVYAYTLRLGRSPEDCKDLTQEFFARLLEKDFLKAVRQEKGKFRSFLLMAYKRFLANEWDRANRLKRGGGQQFISLDDVDSENAFLAAPGNELSPDKAFERRWAATLLQQVQARLADEFKSPDQAELFGRLKVFLGGDDVPSSYAEVGRKVGMSEGRLRVMVHRLRQRYRELLRLEIANTVATPEEVDDEIRYLFASLT